MTSLVEALQSNLAVDLDGNNLLALMTPRKTREKETGNTVDRGKDLQKRAHRKSNCNDNM